MNTLLHGTMAAVLLAASTTVAAQDAPKPTEPGKDELHVSGCVAMGEQGKYVLQHATYIGIASRTKAMPQVTAANPVAPIRSYELAGSTDFKSHVGQKVEVAGTLEKNEDGKPVGTAGSTASPAPEKLNVTSLKSVASNCP